MDHNHSEDRDSEVRSTELGSPKNDQVLAQVKHDLRDILDNTIHPLCDQADAQNADLPAMMAVLAISLTEREDWLPRHRMASLLALLLIAMAARERSEVSKEIERLIEELSVKDA